MSSINAGHAGDAGEIKYVEPEKGSQQSHPEPKRETFNEDIDPTNEVQGTKLVLIHLSICLCTFLVGLVSLSPSTVVHLRTETETKYSLGFQSHRNCRSSYHVRLQLDSRYRLVWGSLYGISVCHTAFSWEGKHIVPEEDIISCLCLLL